MAMPKGTEHRFLLSGPISAEIARLKTTNRCGGQNFGRGGNLPDPQKPAG